MKSHCATFVGEDCVGSGLCCIVLRIHIHAHVEQQPAGSTHRHNHRSHQQSNSYAKVMVHGARKSVLLHPLVEDCSIGQLFADTATTSG